MPTFTQPLAVDASQIATGQLNTARLPDIVEVSTSVQAGGATNYTNLGLHFQTDTPGGSAEIDSK